MARVDTPAERGIDDADADAASDDVERRAAAAEEESTSSTTHQNPSAGCSADQDWPSEGCLEAVETGWSLQASTTNLLGGGAGAFTSFVVVIIVVVVVVVDCGVGVVAIHSGEKEQDATDKNC